MEYILGPKDPARPCIFCGIPGAGPDELRERHERKAVEERAAVEIQSRAQSPRRVGQAAKLEHVAIDRIGAQRNRFALDLQQGVRVAEFLSQGQERLA